MKTTNTDKFQKYVSSIIVDQFLIFKVDYA